MNAARFVALAGAACAIACSELGAQTFSWDSNPAIAGAQGGTGDWTGTNFWLNGALNQAWFDGAQATFGGTAGTVTVNGAVAVAGMSFNTSGYTIAGASAVTLTNALIDVANPVQDSTATISAPIAGTVGLIKGGDGILIMSGAQANTYTGTTFVNRGTLFLSKTGAASINGDVVIGDNLGGGNLVAVQQFASNQIANTAKVTVNANGGWTSFSQSETIGELELNGGTVHFEPAGVLSMSSVTTIANSATAFLRGKVDLGGANRTFNVANGTAATDLIMTPVAVGTDGLFNGGVIKTGTGTLELNGANTFTTLEINGGAISVSDVADIGVPSPLGAGSSFTLNGGTLVFNSAGTDSTNRNIVLGPNSGTFHAANPSQNLTLAGVISGTGGLNKTGTGALRLTATNTFTGPLTMTAAYIEVPTVSDIGVPGPLGAGTNITISGGGLIIPGFGNHSTNRPISIGAFGATFGPGGGTLTLSGPITGTGTLSTTSAGVLVLTGTNTFTGNVFISSSTIRVANGQAIPDTAEVFIGGGANPVKRLDLNNTNETIGSLRGGDAAGGNVTLGSGTLTIGGDNTSKVYAGSIQGTGGVVKIGTGKQTLNGTSTFTGPIAINGGSIIVTDITDSGVTGPLGAGNLITFNGGTLEFTGGVNDTTDRSIVLNASGGGVNSTGPGGRLTLTGSISGSGSLTTTGFIGLTGANTFTGPVIVNGGVLSVPSVANGSFTSPIGQGTSIVINNGGFFLEGFGTHSTDRAVSISGGVSLGPGNGTVTFSGPITGTGGLSVTGPGVLVLSGANLFAGAVSVYNSTLRVANGNAIPDNAEVFLSPGSTPAGFEMNGSTETIGSLQGGNATTGAITLGSGTLRIGANNNPSNYDGVISGTGGIVKIGFGDLILSRASTFGSMTIENGTVFVADVTDAGVPSPIGSGAFLTIGGAGTQGTLAYTGTTDDSMLRNITLSGNGGSIAVHEPAATLTISGQITGPGVFSIPGPGTLVLGGTTNYTGPTLIGLATLRQTGGSRFSNASAFILTNAPGSVLDLNNISSGVGSLAGGGSSGGVVMIGNTTFGAGADGTSTTFSGTMTGTGGFNKVGTGTLTLAGANTYSGVTSVIGGKLRFSGGNAIADTSPLNVDLNGTAEFISGTETVASLLGSGSVALSGGNLNIGANNAGTTFAGVISGTSSLTKVGTGTLTLTNAPTYTGTTNINAGKLALDGGFDTAGGTINIAAGAQLEARNAVSRPITGLGTITATGTLIIGDSNSPSGFNFNGILAVGTQQVILADSDFADLGNTTTLGPGGRLNSINGIRLAVGRSISGSANIGGSISGNLINNGVINGPAQAGQFLSLTGDVTGTGNYAGTIRFTDSFSPGNSAAAISLQNFILGSTNALTLEIGGLVAGSQYDQLNFTASGTLDGILSVTLINGFQPLEGNSFTILNGGTITGTFDAVNLPQLAPGLAWQYVQSASSATLAVIPEPSTLALLLSATTGAICARRSRPRIHFSPQ